MYATRFTATPFRGALAALPLDAALAAPLVDSSPFSLHEGAIMDTVCLADEAQRVAANLAAAAAAGSYSPGQGALRIAARERVVRRHWGVVCRVKPLAKQLTVLATKVR